MGKKKLKLRRNNVQSLDEENTTEKQTSLEQVRGCFEFGYTTSNTM
jgi:hypothetical protein